MDSPPHPLRWAYESPNLHISCIHSSKELALFKFCSFLHNNNSNNRSHSVNSEGLMLRKQFLICLCSRVGGLKDALLTLVHCPWLPRNWLFWLSYDPIQSFSQCPVVHQCRDGHHCNLWGHESCQVNPSQALAGGPDAWKISFCYILSK